MYNSEGHIGPDKILIVNNTLVVNLLLCNALVACEGRIGPDRILIINNTLVVNLVLRNAPVAHEGHIGPDKTEPYIYMYMQY